MFHALVIRFNYGREWCISNQDDTTGVLSQDNLYFRCGAEGQDTIKFILGQSAITTVLPINGVSQLKMSYLSNITSDVQTQLNNCVMLGDLSFNNNLIYVNSNSYINGLYNTLSASIKTTNTNLSNYQSYDSLFNTTLSNNVYFNYVNTNSYINGLYNTLSDAIKTTNTNLSNYQSYYSLFNTTLSNNVYFNYVNKDTLTTILNDYVKNTALTTTLLDYVKIQH